MASRILHPVFCECADLWMTYTLRLYPGDIYIPFPFILPQQWLLALHDYRSKIILGCVPDFLNRTEAPFKGRP